MGTEITISNNQLVQTIEEFGITDVIRPLVKEIYLFDTYVAGTSYIDRKIRESVSVDDKVILRREQDNRFDDKAILILTESQDKLGYIPEKDNSVFSRLMDAGKLLTAKIKKIDWKGDFSKIEISIYLVDF